MGLLDKAKLAAEQAVTKTKEGVEDVQTKRDLGTAYGDLGKKTFELADAGELDRPEFAELVEKIRGLKAKLADDAGEPGAADEAGSDTPAAPPAMPV